MVRPLGVLLAVAVALVTVATLATPVFAQWPTTCVDLNDIVETHLGNHNNVGIYQRVFGDQAEQACQNDHRDDVRGVFAWAFDNSATTAQADTPDLAWPTDCVELNDIVENHLGNHQNVAIYQRVFGDQAEPACRNDHRAGRPQRLRLGLRRLHPTACHRASSSHRIATATLRSTS